jgi:hypothetical protein
VLLPRVYEQQKAAGDQDAQDILKGTSPAAWQSVNLFGSFEFTPSTSKIDIDALAARYADPVYWSKSMRDNGEAPLG